MVFILVLGRGVSCWGNFTSAMGAGGDGGQGEQGAGSAGGGGGGGPRGGGGMMGSGGGGGGTPVTIVKYYRGLYGNKTHRMDKPKHFNKSTKNLCDTENIILYVEVVVVKYKL